MRKIITAKRFSKHVNTNGPISELRPELGNCWMWTGGGSRGYGQFRQSKSRIVTAHRFCYELMRGPVTPGLELDHLCRVRLCVNPWHLEQVTGLENIRRGRPFHPQRLQTHCKRGNHPLSGPNLYINTLGARVCRICDRAAIKAWRRRNAPDQIAQLTHTINAGTIAEIDAELAKLPPGA
jgi:hypothetical protein